MVRLSRLVCGPASAGRLKPALTLIFLIAGTAAAHSVVDVGLSFNVPAFVPVQQNFQYRIIADDRANDIGSGIVVTIILPPQVRFVGSDKSDTWKCMESHLTVTCSADQITPGANPIGINVTAPATTTSLHATANVQSLGSLDVNAANDNASSAVVAFDASLCTAAAPQIAAPADGASESPVVSLAWTEVPGVQSYSVYTAVEGAAAAPAAIATRASAAIVAEPGTSEWWVVASFATCPPLESAHRRFTAPITLARPVRIFAGDATIDATHDGPVAAATFRSPYGLALSPAGDLYVSDQADNVVRQITNGNVTTIVGRAGVPGNTDGQFALLHGPRGLAVGPLDGFLFAADTLNQEIRLLYTTPNPPYIPAYDAGGTPGVAGMVDDTSDKARFNAPSGVAAASRGTLYVADTANNRIRMMEEVPGYVGFYNITTFASGLHAPLGAAVGPGDVVYIADTDDGSIRKADSTVLASGFDHPTGIASDSRGNLFVTDRTSVYRIAPSGLVTLVVSGLNAPAGIVVDASDRIFVAQSGAHTILVIDPAQNLTRRHAVH